MAEGGGENMLIYSIFSAARNDQVSEAHGRLDEVVESLLHELVVLVEDAHDLGRKEPE